MLRNFLTFGFRRYAQSLSPVLHYRLFGSNHRHNFHIPSSSSLAKDLQLRSTELARQVCSRQPLDASLQVKTPSN